MKTDYPELEGKKIVYSYYENEEPENYQIGIVAGCNYNVGISIVNIKNKDDLLICINYKLHANHYGKKNYLKVFQYLIGAIKKGEVFGELANLAVKGSRDPISNIGIPTSNCPWR